MTAQLVADGLEVAHEHQPFQCHPDLAGCGNAELRQPGDAQPGPLLRGFGRQQESGGQGHRTVADDDAAPRHTFREHRIEDRVHREHPVTGHRRRDDAGDECSQAVAGIRVERAQRHGHHPTVIERTFDPPGPIGRGSGTDAGQCEARHFASAALLRSMSTGGISFS